MFNQICILGAGLLGASVMKAAKARNLCERTIAWSRRPETRQKCLSQPWCDQVCDTPEQAVAQADLVILCTPVKTIAPLAAQIAPALKPDTLVTDVGSTKALICRQASQALTNSPAHFIGSHPMAGSEKTGLEHARADLFDQRACLVTPMTDTPPQPTERIVAFWSALGMEVVTLSPDQHDEIVAHVSHLPHALASVLCAQLGTQNADWRNLSGPGLRDSTRIAAGDPGLWKEILLENREEVLRAIDHYSDHLHTLREAIANNNELEIRNILERGKAFRDTLRPV